MSALILNRLLRAPRNVAASCCKEEDLPAIARTSIAAVIAGSAAFGGVIGSFRGGAQIAYAGVKFPLAMLATLALTAPAFHALTAAFGKPLPARSVVALSLASTARASLVLLALAPALWLLYSSGAGYHAAALWAVVAYAVAGVAALSILVRGMAEGRARLAMGLAFGAVFLATASQTSWILRPYLLRPRAESIPFIRAREGSLSDSLWTSWRSARGIYNLKDLQNELSNPEGPVRRRAPPGEQP